MPVPISQRCWQCREVKPRDAFPYRRTGSEGKRQWSVYCKACLAANPELWYEQPDSDLDDWEKPDRGEGWGY